MRLVLTLPPSVNHMYRNARIGNRTIRILSPAAKAWYEESILVASIWRKKQKWTTAQNKTIVYLWYYFPDKRKRDTHNTIKLLLDCLQDALIFTDDRYAIPRIMDYEIDKLSPRVEIEFEIVKEQMT